MEEWHGDFLPNAIGNLRREAHNGSAIGRNGVLIWRNFGLPPSTIDNTDPKEYFRD